MTREWWWLKGAATRWTKKKKSNFPNQKVISHTTHPLSCPFPSNSDSLSCFPPAELLSACHELRCRYGCVMTRNGTFCFCADGFEVGEDGTSCRGRIQLRCGSSGGGRAPAMEHSSPRLPLPSARLLSDEQAGGAGCTRTICLQTGPHVQYITWRYRTQFVFGSFSPSFLYWGAFTQALYYYSCNFEVLELH